MLQRFLVPFRVVLSVGGEQAIVGRAIGIEIEAARMLSVDDVAREVGRPVVNATIEEVAAYGVTEWRRIAL